MTLRGGELKLDSSFIIGHILQWWSLMSCVNCVMGPFSKTIYVPWNWLPSGCFTVLHDSKTDRCDWNLSQTRKCKSQPLAIIKYWRDSSVSVSVTLSPDIISDSLMITLGVMTKWGWLETTLQAFIIHFLSNPFTLFIAQLDHNISCWCYEILLIPDNDNPLGPVFRPLLH